jgi:hypothetical protein
MPASILGDGAASIRAVVTAVAVAEGVADDVDEVSPGPEVRELDVPQPTTSSDRTTVPATTEQLIATSERTLLRRPARPSGSEPSGCEVGIGTAACPDEDRDGSDLQMQWSRRGDSNP